ncbi:NADase-type glycan-binding domain-containing protein [Streptomyces sp. 6N223]|uniref:NADase-type glycan-binding domain-containing protein n=1 Tax=Streptomyces sp. 6N223 TaxID=3457412 RepID=UPI003FCF2D39
MTTQNCAECGTRAEPGQSFCDACGAVLSWTDQAGARSGAHGGTDQAWAGAPGPGSAGASTGSSSGGSGWDTSPRPVGTSVPDSPPDGAGPDNAEPESASASPQGDARPHPDAAPGAPGQAPPPQAPGAAGTVPPAASAGDRGSAPPENETDATVQMRAVAPGDAMSDRARRLVVPVAEPVDPAAPPPVSPVLPGRPAPARPPAQDVVEEPGVDAGVPCPWCATSNRPDRHYCARCAMPMTGDEQAAPGRRPWWRRMLDRRNREAPWAGDRPRLRRTFEHILRWVVAALVLTLLILIAVHIPDGVRATRDHFAKRAPVDPEDVRASNSYPDHAARLAFDKLNDTWWGPGVTQSGEGEWVEARFEQPARLLDLVITPGVSTRADEIAESALPHRIEARITTEDGSATTRELTLDQGAGGQRLDFRADGVTSVRLTIVSAHGAAPDKQVAVAEIEFFGPSSGNGL